MGGRRMGGWRDGWMGGWVDGGMGGKTKELPDPKELPDNYY
jgi:hypothetical protein